EDKEMMYNFGKHKGKTILEVHKEEPGYYGWFIGATTDFPNYTKKVLKKEMERLKELYPEIMKTTEKKNFPSQKNFHKKPQNDNQSYEDKLNALKNKFNR